MSTGLNPAELLPTPVQPPKRPVYNMMHSSFFASKMVHVVFFLLQLDSAPQIPTMKTFSTLGNCSVTVSDLDLLRILFHGDSISEEYEARYPFN